MSVLPSTGSMDSTMNVGIIGLNVYVITFTQLKARDGTTSSCGRRSLTASTAYPSPPLWMRRFSAATADSVPISRAWSRSDGSWDPPMSRTQVSITLSSSASPYLHDCYLQDCCVTCCGQTLTRMSLDGEKMTEGWVNVKYRELELTFSKHFSGEFHIRSWCRLKVPQQTRSGLDMQSSSGENWFPFLAMLSASFQWCAISIHKLVVIAIENRTKP